MRELSKCNPASGIAYKWLSFLGNLLEQSLDGVQAPRRDLALSCLLPATCFLVSAGFNSAAHQCHTTTDQHGQPVAPNTVDSRAPYH